ncbi:DAR GTPase 2, mitochondrial isoform X4 [Arachis hypogaea]|uniref:DAR GTPase 2, mitochondrial isoform X4 n=2 Tax=Arachis hypogaea TaxID=3818 RepID=UPI003B2121EC
MRYQDVFMTDSAWPCSTSGMAATATHFARQVGTAVKEKIGRTKRAQAPWYTSLMAAASRALVERLPLVDLIVEVRDARIPLSSECELLRNNLCSSRQIIALNKADLAGRSGSQAWTDYFRRTNCISCGVDAHNKESIKELLGLIQRQVRELRGTSHANYTATVMLIGIPNVGKSALANSLHQVGRISAAGTIGDCLVSRKEIAEYFLAILNSSEEYKKWVKLSSDNTVGIYHGIPKGCLTFSEFEGKKKKQIPTDHTQVFNKEIGQSVFFTS